MSATEPRSPLGPRVGFATAVARALRRYAQFSGRASWAEYWWFFLFLVLLAALLYLCVAVVAASANSDGAAKTIGALLLGVSLVLVLWFLFLIVPVFAITVRRLHDTERTGWWAVLLVVPLLSIIVFLFCLLPGNDSANKYGPPST
jgi:uncharacterized membrane protein YhaH (DUF805 family)